VKHAKFLGVFIDNRLKWNDHIVHKCNQISKAIGIMNRIKKLLPKKILYTLYNSLILPHLTYGVVAWGNTDASLIKRISTLQKKAIRLISGSKYNSHTSPIFKYLKTLNFHDLFQTECCKIYMKYCRNELPSYLMNQFQIDHRPHHYNIRQSSVIPLPLIRTKLEEQLIRYKVATSWNSLPSHLKSLKNEPKSLKYFTSQFKKFKIAEYHSICQINNCYICNNS
jgi:hypothetical protein